MPKPKRKKPKGKNVHVSLNKGPGETWKVTQDRKTLSTHRTQKEAEQVARNRAKKDKVERVTHGMDGRIRSKDSYGNDPSSIKDTEN